MSDPVPLIESVAETGLILAGAALVRAELAAAAAVVAARRARVLAHPDLRDRLTGELGYARAEQWNGYVPPALCQDQEPERLHDVQGFPNPTRAVPGRTRNDSGRRAVLVEICAEALRRENEAVFGLLAGLLISPRLYRSHFADHGTTAGETERSDQYDSATPFGFGRTNQKGTS